MRHPGDRPPWQSRVNRATLLAIALTCGLIQQHTAAGELHSVSPRGVSSSLPAHITGTGIDRSPKNNAVYLTVGDRTVGPVYGKNVVDVDKSRSVRRITVIVPDGVPIGTASLRLVNEVTGETSTGATVEIIGLSLPRVVSAPRGSQVDVEILGTPNVIFVADSTTVSFGAGITTKSVRVESPTSLIATISIDRRAAIGPRSVSTETTAQTALLGDGFAVTAAGTPNLAPLADPGGPYAGVTGQALAVDGSKSTDPDGDPLTYAWDFGDGGKGTGPTPSHTYTAAGSYTISLTVSDGRGGSHTATTTAVISPAPVENRAPMANPGGPYAGTVAETVTFDGSGSSDPDGDPLTYAWEFGDGAKATGAVVSHAFTAADTFTVVLTVSDGRGGTHTAKTTAVISAAPPGNRTPTANPGGPYNGTAGEAVTFDGTGSSDPDADPLSYSWDFGDGSKGTGATPSHTFGAAGMFTVSLTVADPAGASHTATTTATIGAAPPPNVPPRFTSTPVTGATTGQAYSYQAVATDDDGDEVSYELTQKPDGMTIAVDTGLVTWTPGAGDVGTVSVTIRASDGRGGTATQSFDITVGAAPAVLTGISASPASIRFSEVDATRPLVVSGARSDGSTTDLTAGSTGTTYESSNTFVASVSLDGLVTARGNGEAAITVRNGGFSDTVAVVVEVGVELESLELTPVSSTLRLAGAAQQLALKGQFSDGSQRDLTSVAGTAFESSAPAVATVSKAGLAVAVASGRAEITARHGDLSAVAEVVVAISDGQGFLRGTVFDDSRGLPLKAAAITLLSDGGGLVDPPATAVSDDNGQYVLSGRAGDAILRVQSERFTTVERRVQIPASGVVRALDARLTPIDARQNVLQSVFGGQASNAAATHTLAIPPGALPSNTDIRLTAISPQGPAGRLPFGWSPIAGADVSPHGLVLQGPSTLIVPNASDVPAGIAVTVAFYDPAAHMWTAHSGGEVASDGRTISTTITRTGQYAFVVADPAPSTPPQPVVGHPLAGVDTVDVPDGVTADGAVVPRSAPPGAAARATGRIGVSAPIPLPSGTRLQVHVSERFDLIDSTSVSPLPFVQDVLVHARPRPPSGGALGAAFPVTPSRSYTIQELMHGVVKLDVRRAHDDIGGVPSGPEGAIVTNPDGDALTIPPGALSIDTLVHLLRLPEGSLTSPVPQGTEFVAGVDVQVVGAAFAAPALLSVPLPPAITAADQILLVQSFVDVTGVRRTRIAGLGRLEGDRLVSQLSLNGITFPGVTAGGQYYFLKSTQPLGFVAGLVSAGGGVPSVITLVASSTAPFVDVTGATGQYIVAAAVGADAVISGVHLLTRDAGSGTANPAFLNSVVALPLSLVPVPPQVVAVSPGAGALNVPLDTSILVDFSEAVEPSTITATSVTLQSAAGGLAVHHLLSQDRRRLTIRPQAPLPGKTRFTLTLSPAITDLSGAPLAGFTSVSFTTLDPTKPPQPPPGQIVASLPDEDGFVLVFGTGGTAEASSPVTVTNLRTQETTTVLALADGSFRVRISAVIGDELALTLRDGSGRPMTMALTQFQGDDGSTSVGAAGGVFADSNGRLGTILPRALVRPGIFKFEQAPTAPAVPLSGALSYIDRFSLRVEGAEFNRLSSLTLTENQGRFSPATALGLPFEATGELTVPADFLINGSVRYTATAQDATGVRRSTAAATVVVAASADAGLVESAQAAEFPSVHLTAPKQALQNQVIGAHAVAPLARIDLHIPAPATSSEIFLLTRDVKVSGEPKLAVLDVMTHAMSSVGAELQTSGRTLPGITSAGEYGVVGSTEPLVFITGQLVGAAGFVSVDGSPFVFETTSANGRFSVPVVANQSFTLRFVNADGSLRGTASGQAPGSGRLDIGDPLGISTGQLTLTAEPDQNSVVDIGNPIVVRFSEAIDQRTLPAALVVTDPAGTRVFGSFSSPDGGKTIEFRPSRRWRYGTTYRFGVATTVLGASGARLSQPFNGQFTTFVPSVLGTTAAGNGLGVAVSGSLAIVGTGSGARLLDVSSPATPQVLATLTLAGGARGIAILPSTTLTDRNGQSHSGTFAVIVSGDAITGGRLGVFDVTTPSAPVLLGGAQLTAIPGQPTPLGVPDAVGTPQQVLVTGDYRALVAIENVGLVSVVLGRAIPNDLSNPGNALGARYPAAAFETVTGVALLGDRVVLAGTAGLILLDAATLERRGQVFTGAALIAVDALPSFAMDANGDGVVADGEVFDLAIATGGSDGTVQFFRLPPTGDPSLLSVVRLPAEAEGLVVNGEERLAYVASRNTLVVLDLDGPASVQPLDLDRNARDDRLLAQIETRGAARRVAVNLVRAVAYVADGAAGLTAVRVLPPRTRFESLLRDPLKARQGDEEAILHAPNAFTTDEALMVTLHVASAGQALSLTIEESPAANGQRLLSFPDGTTRRALEDGVNSVTLDIAPGAVLAGSLARLKVQSGAAQVIAFLDLRIHPPDTTLVRLERLLIAPDPIAIGPADRTIQLAVGGLFSDGRVRNLTLAAAGTQYATGDAHVVTVGTDGLVRAQAGGTTFIGISNGSARAFASVRVEHPPAVIELAVSRQHVTLTTAGVAVPLLAVARLSDGTMLDAAGGVNTRFTSSDPSIVEVSGDGTLIARAEGVATITIENGTVRTSVEVAVEFRIPTVVTGIVLAAPERITMDEGRIPATATLSGTGALDGIPITFSLTDGASEPVTQTSNVDGISMAALGPLSSTGTVTIVATVQNPADGTTFTSTRSVVLVAGTGDHEPNDSIAAASGLAFDRTATGSVGGSSDQRDVFRFESTTDGTVTLSLVLSDATTIPSRLALVLLSANGAELQRVPVTTAGATAEFSVQAGESFAAVESTDAAVAYQVKAAFVQAPVVVGSVSPAAGGPGTLVRLDGSGFSNDVTENIVFFGFVAGRIVSATPTRLEAIVPATALDGAIRVVVRSRAASGPVFVTGNTGPPPPIILARPANPLVRMHPATGAVIDARRLIVHLDPSATRSDAESLATNHGGVVAGVLPEFNGYVFEFSQVTTVREIDAIRRQLGAQALVERSSYEAYKDPTEYPLVFDSRDGTMSLPRAASGGEVEAGIALAYINLFKAFEAIRRTPPFNVRLDAGQPPLAPVKVAVIDTGFAPPPALLASEFTDASGTAVVEMVDVFNGVSGSNGLLVPTTSYEDPRGHGTSVTSIIAAVNSGQDGMTGGLNGLFQPGERPYKVWSYRASDDTGTMTDSRIFAALLDIRRHGDVDVVNMSLGYLYGRLADAEANLEAYRPYLSSLGATLIVASAGNEGADARHHSPSALQRTLDNVVAVGGTELTVNTDQWVRFGTKHLENYTGGACTGSPQITGSAIQWVTTVQSGSNCGPAVTLAAPGDDVLAVGLAGYEKFSGTSAAAPLIASVAAVLRAIGYGGSAGALRTLLADTGDPIDKSWNTPILAALQTPMTRVNALEAVKVVLGALHHQYTYIAEQQTGQIVAIPVDPLAGELRPDGPLPVVRIPLTLTKDGVTFKGTRALTLAMSPTGEQFYALVRAEQPAGLGDGILIVSTVSHQPVDFIPLSGVPFPSSGSTPPVLLDGLRVPMVVSPDGRLLYVATGSGLTIVNTVEGTIVRSYYDLPAPFKLRAGTRPVAELANRLTAIRDLVRAGVMGRQGTRISALALSPAGHTLYAAFQTGTGGGLQPGGIIPIKIDLHTDASPTLFGLQADLSRYLSVEPTLEMQSAGAVGGSDEPTAVAVGPGDEYVYMFNGGLSGITGITAEDLAAARFAELIGGAGFGIAAATSFTGGISGTLNAINSFETTSSTLYEQLLREIRLLSDSGIVLMSGAGFTGVFDRAIESQRWLFPTEVVTGWNVRGDGTPIITDADTGLLVTQFTFPEVYVKSPSAVAMKPRSPSDTGHRRALVAFTHTGNFGVLDLDAQERFSTITSPNPAMANLQDTLFKAFVGVTPSVSLGPDAWPDRGRFTGADKKNVPSPDDAFLFVSDLQYAQNGRFAVAVHAGVNDPHTINTTMPDFVGNPSVRLKLLQLGFHNAAGDPVIFGPDDTPYVPGASITFERGGGAVSVIRDTDVSEDFSRSLSKVVTDDDGSVVPYFARIPICKWVDVRPGTNQPVPQCAQEAVTRVAEYAAEGALKKLVRPRAAAIQPFVMIETPRMGDHVALETGIHVSWRDRRVTAFKTRVFEILSDGTEVLPYETSGSLTQLQRELLSMRAEFGGLFPPTTDPGLPAGPSPNTRYRVEIQLLADSEELSRTHVDVLFENQTGTVPTATLDLSPTILPANGQLQAILREIGASPENVTSEAAYSWLNGGTDGAPLLSISTTQVRDRIAAHLSASAGSSVSVSEIPAANFSVSPTGAVSATAPGLQVVVATFEDIVSSPTIVLSGFTVERISLEPAAAQPASGAGSLGPRIAGALGAGQNAPLVIAPTDSGFVDDDGQIVLADVVLRYAAGGAIHLSDLMDALRFDTTNLSIERAFQRAVNGNPAPIGATPTWRNAQALVELMQPANPSPSPSILFSTSSAGVASVLSGGAGFNGRIASNSAGLGIVSGTVDLGGFGQGTDGVLVWSLASLDSASIRPAVTSIKRSTPATPGPTVRSRAGTARQSALVPIPSGFADVQTAVDQILPRAFGAVNNQFVFDSSVGGPFTFGLKGSGSAAPAGFTFTDFTLTFDVPNDGAPSITNSYVVADTLIAALGARDTFTQHLVHQNRVGTTPIRASLQIEGLGSATGLGQIVVCDCSGPVVSKRLLGPSTVQAGDVVRYELTVSNPTTSPVSVTSVVDEFLLDSIVLSTSTVPVGMLEADSFVTIPIEITAPFAGTLRNTIAAPGFTVINAPAVSVLASENGVVITELVLAPQQDWNDSTGGNGAAFDTTPGTGTIDAHDIWVEVMGPTTATQNWAIRMTDTAGTSVSRPLGPVNTTSQVSVVSGFGALTQPVVLVELVDATGVVRQTLDIMAIEAILGTATGAADESLTWSVSGSPTAVLQQFVRRPSSIGVFNPF